MKLLFDENLSFKLCQTVADLFPKSNHVRLLGLSEVGDRVLWDYAKANGFTIVSQDVDFAEMAALLRAPPKVSWLRGGNLPTAAISALMRRHAELIVAFGNDDEATCLEILVLLRHKFIRRRRAVEARQHGHRGKTLTRASMMRRRTVAIEFGT